MKVRFFSGLLVIVLLVPLSACPREPAVSTGVWVFDVDGFLNGVVLEDGGQAQTPDPLPPEANSMFAGTLTWRQSGSAFTLTQTVGASSTNYRGTVESSTSIIDGKLTGTTTTWTAMKL